MVALGLDLVSGECFFVAFWVFPSLVSSSLLSTGYLGLGGFQGLSFVFSSLPPFLLVCPLCLERLGLKGECWHGIWPDGICGVWPKAAGMRPVAYGPHWPRLPPPASLAPTSLACPHAEE